MGSSSPRIRGQKLKKMKPPPIFFLELNKQKKPVSCVTEMAMKRFLLESLSQHQVQNDNEYIHSLPSLCILQRVFRSKMKNPLNSDTLIA